MRLQEWLSLFSLAPGMIVEFAQGEHATTLVIDKDGSFRYYDPNFPFEVKPLDSSKLSKVIQDTKYKLLQRLYDPMEIDFICYRFEKKGKKLVQPSPLQEILKVLSPKVKESTNGWSLLHMGVILNHEELIEHALKKEPGSLLKKDVHGQTPLDLAASLHNEDMVKKLLQGKGSVITTQMLVSALQSHNASFIQAALQSKGFDFDLIFKEPTRFHSTPLELSCIPEHREIAELFIKKMEDVNQKDESGHSFLYHAIEKENEQLVQRLLEEKANPIGADVFDLAANPQCFQIAKRLVEAIKDLNQKDEKGNTFADYAVKRRNQPLIDLLKKRGVRIESKPPPTRRKRRFRRE